MKKIFFITILTLFLFSCNKNETADAYGNFFANEIILSAENNGKIIKSNFDEGDEIKKGDTLAIIDQKILFLQKQQLLAKKKAISSKFQNIIAQVKVLKKQKSVLETEKKRIENLLQDSAVSKQKYDDIKGKISILEQKIDATKTGNSSIFGELDALDASIKMVDEQISRCFIISPINGIVLEKYVNDYELCNIGKPIFKIANLDTMELTAYVSEDQLSEIKLGQHVKVSIDSIDGEMKNFTGTIKWISSTAEFTPKIIQTRKERVNLVYAVKIDVKNNGSIKIGMPAEVNF